MFNRRQRAIFLIAFAVAAFAVCIPLIYSLKESPPAPTPQPQQAASSQPQTTTPQTTPQTTQPTTASQPEPRPAPNEAQTVRANNGQGTTATYQVQESTGQSPDCQKPAPEIVFYTAAPASVRWGDKAVLSWRVTGAEEIKVAGQTYRTERGSVEVDPRQWVRVGPNWRTDGVPFPLAAVAQAGCAPVERSVSVTFKEGVPADEK